MKATPLSKVKSNTSAPTTPKPHRSPIISESSKNPFKLNDWPYTGVQNTLPLLMPLPASVATSIAICTRPPTLRANKDEGLKSPFVIMPFMPGAKTTARCAIGVVRPDIILRTATALGIAATAHIAATMGPTAFALMTFAMRTKTAKFTPLTPTSNAVTVPLLTMTLTSKGR